MRLSKKKLKFLSELERTDYILVNQINQQEYPKSLLDALVKDGLVVVSGNKVTSETKP